MALASSNTYIEPVAGSTLNIARIDVNRSLRSILTNFKSTSRPVAVNLVAGGGNIGEQDGMLFRSETTNALYISDANQVKSSPVGGNFTRVGIGNRVENGIVALAANATSYEIGELVATVSQDGGLAANSRLYLCVSNTLTVGSTSGFLDVGAPLGYSIGTNDNVTFTGQSVTAIRFLATSNVGINTTSPATRLHVNGDVTVTDRIIRAGNTQTQIRFPATNTVTIETSSVERFRVASGGNIGIGSTSPNERLEVVGNIHVSGGDRTIYNRTNHFLALGTNNTERMRITATGTIGIGTTTPVTALDVVGTVRATDFNSVSDISLKQDIQLIENSLDKLRKINGYTFTFKDTQKNAAGVIAQEIEKILPQAVQGEEGNKSVAYGNLIALLIEAIKELSDRVDVLQKTK